MPRPRLSLRQPPPIPPCSGPLRHSAAGCPPPFPGEEPRLGARGRGLSSALSENARSFAATGPGRGLPARNASQPAMGPVYLHCLVPQEPWLDAQTPSPNVTASRSLGRVGNQPARPVPPAGDDVSINALRCSGDLGSRPSPLGLCCSPIPSPLDPFSGIAPFPRRHPAFLLRGPHSRPALKLLISVFVFIGRTITVMGAGRAL